MDRVRWFKVTKQNIWLIEDTFIIFEYKCITYEKHNKLCLSIDRLSNIKKTAWPMLRIYANERPLKMDNGRTVIAMSPMTFLSRNDEVKREICAYTSPPLDNQKRVSDEHDVRVYMYIWFYIQTYIYIYIYIYIYYVTVMIYVSYDMM